VWNKPFVIDKVIVATGAKKEIEMFFEDFVYLPVYNSIFFKNKARRIAKGRRKRLYGSLRVQANQELSFGDLEKMDFRYHHAFLKNRPMFLKKNAMPSAAATIACTR